MAGAMEQTTKPEATYVADGRTAVWRVPFPYRTPADVGVKIIDEEGNETVLAIGKTCMLRGFDVFCFVPRGQTVKIWLKAPVADVSRPHEAPCPGIKLPPPPPPPAPHRHGYLRNDGRLEERARVVITDEYGRVDTGDVSVAELASMQGVRENVQKQLDRKARAFDAITNWEIEHMMTEGD